MKATYATEADMCDAFMAVVRGAGLIAYPETLGWDILVVDPATGDQCGVEAKLRPNMEVLAQAVRHSEAKSGPDFHAVLVAKRGSAPFNELARYLRLHVLLQHHEPSRDRWVREWVFPDWSERWKHPRRHSLPAAVPPGRAGCPGPVRWSRWKEAAMKVCAILETRGTITTDDFRTAGISHTLWVERGWIVDSGARLGRKTVYARGQGALPSERFPDALAAAIGVLGADSMTAPTPNPWDALEQAHDCAACPSWEASGCETADGRVCRCACHDATVTPDSAHRAADALGLHIVAADGAEVLA